MDASAPVLAARVNGVVLHYTDSGTAGPTVMLLHGGMGDLGSWPHQRHVLVPRYRVVAYSRRHSHPNRNDSRRNGQAHCIEGDIDDFLSLQAALGAGPSHLVATSYGALLALAIALRSPAQVASLALAEPPLHRWLCVNEAGQKLYDTFIRDVWRAAGQSFEQGLPRHAMQLLTEGMWGRPVLGTWSKDRVDAAMRNALAMHKLIKAQDPFPDLDRGAVSRLRMPTLLLHGELTSAHHVQVVIELGRVMRHARRVEIPNAGHGSPHENPQAFNAAVVTFLESQRAPAGVVQ